MRKDAGRDGHQCDEGRVGRRALKVSWCGTWARRVAP